jgi:tRNA threonylcarbamoyladenosine biosynthesis protein TsaE
MASDPARVIDISQKRIVAGEDEMLVLGAELAEGLQPGDLVTLDGPLGAGKTTLVRGILRGIGHDGPVRSPTFTLIQLYDTKPPVLHADLYRLKSAAGLGLEEFECSHVLLVEWSDRLENLLDRTLSWQIEIGFGDEGGRWVSILPPSRYSI